MGTNDFASRLRAKFSRRRHSAEASFTSSTQSAAEGTSSLGSRHWDWHLARGNSRGHQDDPNRRSASQDPAARRGRSSQRRGHNNTLDTDSQPEHREHGRHRRRHPEADEADAAPKNSRSAPSASIEATSTPAVRPATTSSLTAGDTAPDGQNNQNNPLSRPGPRQSRAGLAPSDELGNDLRRSWQAPQQPQPQSESQSRPNERPSPPHSQDVSPNSTPTRLRLRPSNPNLDRIHEDSSAETSESPAPPSDADADADADAEARRHDDSLNSHHTPSTPSAGVATSNVFGPSPGQRPTPDFSPTSSPRPPGPPRRQSLLSNRQSTLIKTLLHSPPSNDLAAEHSLLLPIDADMVTRKIWVRRPHASPTLITINEDDLVDDVRDLILRKYANSLGRTFDSPDLNIRVCPRDQHKERLLGPEEPIARTLDAYFPGGQTVEEALVIDIPRRAPKASPRIITHGGTVYYDEGRPSENGEGYFPPVNAAVSSPHLPVAVPVHANPQVPHSIAIIGTGQVAPIPSPGGNRSTRSYRDRVERDRVERPRLGRTHTSSPTIIANGAANLATTHGTTHVNIRQPHHRTLSNSSEKAGMPPAAPAVVPVPPLPTPPAPEQTQARVNTPPPRMASPRPPANRAKKPKKNPEHLNLPPGMLNGTIPPINVLIVEDNPINLKLLEAFVKRLKVRWQTAMNGLDAVKKWRTGGFHLVLMDIQLPVMNGLDATREIRRLERVNTIGVFSSTPTNSVPEEKPGELKDQDRLENLALFMSPVIIVALTASSLQSDRHEALAAGCNDFLTKVCVVLFYQLGITW